MQVTGRTLGTEEAVAAGARLIGGRRLSSTSQEQIVPRGIVDIIGQCLGTCRPMLCEDVEAHALTDHCGQSGAILVDDLRHQFLGLLAPIL